MSAAVSALQKARAAYTPKLPKALRNGAAAAAVTGEPTTAAGDVEKIKAMMKAGEGMKFTFHRAIDACNDPLEALKILVELGFDKVLTSGCKPKAADGIEMIAKMQQQYGDKIKIMAGGGVNVNNVKKIINETSVSNCHASLTVDVDNYCQNLYPEKVDNTGAAMCWKVSSPSLIKEMLNIVKDC